MLTQRWKLRLYICAFVLQIACNVSLSFLALSALSTRDNQPEVWLRADSLSPLCRWILSGCTQFFEGWSRGTVRRSQCRAYTRRNSPAVRLRSAWRCSGPCCAAIRSVPWDLTADSPCRSSVVTWSYPCRDTPESLACRAGRRRGCRW